MNNVRMVSIKDKRYVRRLKADVKLKNYYQCIIQTIFTQMISNFDQKPEEETLFLKLKGFSMSVKEKNGSWAEFYDVLKSDLGFYIR